MREMQSILPPATARHAVRAILRWFGQHARDLPWRRTRDPYAIWVAEVMLQQTRVTTVNPYWQRWMQTLPTVEALAKAAPEQLRKLWEGLGYYRRLQYLQQAARHILSHHAGQLPQRYEDLLALPGIGPYTAGAICSIAYNQPTPVVDGNVVRVLARWLGRPLSSNSPAAWAVARQLVRTAARMPPVPLAPLAFDASTPPPPCPPCSAFNQALMELGSTICLPRQPLCHACPVHPWCAYRQSPGQPPQSPTRRAPVRDRHLWVWIVHRRGRWLVRQRAPNEINASYWELPTFEISAEPSPPTAWPAPSWFRPLHHEPLCRLTHHITRYRYHVRVYPAELLQPWPPGRWFTRAQLHQQPMTRLSRKILQRLLPE